MYSGGVGGCEGGEGGAERSWGADGDGGGAGVRLGLLPRVVLDAYGGVGNVSFLDVVEPGGLAIGVRLGKEAENARASRGASSVGV